LQETTNTCHSQIVKKDCVWLVTYTAKLPLSMISPEDLVCECGERHDIDEVRTISDTKSVLSGPDGQDAINGVFEKVMGSTVAPQLTDFQVIGLKLLVSGVEVL